MLITHSVTFMLVRRPLAQVCNLCGTNYWRLKVAKPAGHTGLYDIQRWCFVLHGWNWLTQPVPFVVCLTFTVEKLLEFWQVPIQTSVHLYKWDWLMLYYISSHSMMWYEKTTKAWNTCVLLMVKYAFTIMPVQISMWKVIITICSSRNIGIKALLCDVTTGTQACTSDSDHSSVMSYLLLELFISLVTSCVGLQDEKHADVMINST